MKEFYSVEEVQKILLKDKETVLRYIRNGIIKDEKTIKSFLEHNIILNTDIKNDIAYITVQELKAIKCEDTIILKDDSKDTMEFKKKLKKAYTSLILKNPNSKPYKITKDSLLLLLERRFNKSLDVAISILNQFEQSMNIPLNQTNNYETEALILDTPKDTIPENKLHSYKIVESFKSTDDKKKFIKGLYLLQMIDGTISEEERKMIFDRASLLGITQNDIHKWVPNPYSMNAELIIPEIKFTNPHQIAVFFLEAILLAWQDHDYSESEKQLIRLYAANNNLSEQILKNLEDKVFNEMISETVDSWLKTIN